MQPLFRFSLALLLTGLAACSDPPTTLLPAATAAGKLMPEADPNNDDHSRIVFCKPSIHPFWTKFRTAVLAENLEAIADMTEFPLAITIAGKGPGKLSREQFIKELPQFLKAEPTDRYFIEKLNITSMKEWARRTPTLEKDDCVLSEGLLHFDRWQFFLRPEGWRLGHVETRTFSFMEKLFN